MPRSEHTEVSSTLPNWLVTRIPKKPQLGIQCPRKDCKRKAVVTLDWLRSMPQIGRSCTYCFKTNRIPKELVK